MWLLSAHVQKNLPEAKVKSYGVRTLTDEISGKPGVDCVAWLLAAPLTQICNEKEQAEQGEIQNAQE